MIGRDTVHCERYLIVPISSLAQLNHQYRFQYKRESPPAIYHNRNAIPRQILDKRMSMALPPLSGSYNSIVNALITYQLLA